MADFCLRFDIYDRKGLEITILTALMTFHDMNEVYHTVPEVPPVPSPQPAQRTGAERIAELHATRGDINEILVEESGSIGDYAKYTSSLLQVSPPYPISLKRLDLPDSQNHQDEAMLFVSIRSFSHAEVQKVLKVADQARRIHSKQSVSFIMHNDAL